MQRLIDWALSQRLLVATVVAAIAVYGYFAYRTLPIDAFPDVSTTQVKIIMKAPGMTPERLVEELDRQVRLPGGREEAGEGVVRSPGISVTLSALFPRYDFLHAEAARAVAASGAFAHPRRH